MKYLEMLLCKYQQRWMIMNLSPPDT